MGTFSWPLASLLTVLMERPVIRDVERRLLPSTMAVMRILMVVVGRVVVAEDVPLSALLALKDLVAIALRLHPPLAGAESR